MALFHSKGSFTPKCLRGSSEVAPRSPRPARALVPDNLFLGESLQYLPFEEVESHIWPRGISAKNDGYFPKKVKLSTLVSHWPFGGIPQESKANQSPSSQQISSERNSPMFAT